jgi:hypothetical protein
VKYVWRVLLALLSAGWVYLMFGSIIGLLAYIMLPWQITSFPVVDMQRDLFTYSLVWLAAVAVFWGWRLGGRANWAVAVLSAAGLVPVWLYAQPVFVTVKAAFGNGGNRPVRVVGDSARLFVVGERALFAAALWTMAMILFWAWRLWDAQRESPSGSA